MPRRASTRIPTPSWRNSSLLGISRPLSRAGASAAVAPRAHAPDLSGRTSCPVIRSHSAVRSQTSCRS